MAFVQAFAGSADNFVLTYTTGAVTFTAGNWIVIGVYLAGGTGAITGITSSQSDTITLLNSPGLGAPPGSQILYVYGIPSCVGGSTTFTITNPVGCATMVTGLEMSGRGNTLAAVSKVGAGVYNSGATTTHTGDSIAGVSAGDDVVWIATDCNVSAGTDTFSSGTYTLPAGGQLSGASANTAPQVTGYLTNVTAGSYQVSYTTSLTVSDGSAIVSLHSSTYNSCNVAWLS